MDSFAHTSYHTSGSETAYQLYNLWNTNPFLLETLKTFDQPRKIKKGSYIIAIISKSSFVGMGAELLNNGIFFIPKEYKGTSHFETHALLGIPKHLVSDLIKEDSTLLDSIRSESKLNYVPGLNMLSCARISDPLSKFLRYLNHCNDNDLLLFNIEPMGTGRLKRCYPVPYITVPGGRMDDIDNHSFESCGLREFREETGFDISFCHKEITRQKIKKYNNKNKKWFIYTEPPPGLGYPVIKKDLPYSINMYFLVKINL